MKVNLKITERFPFLWLQKKKLKKQKMLNISFLILTFALSKTNMTLINFLLCTFITVVLLDILINFRDIFSLNKQILCALPFSPQSLIENYVFAMYIKISLILFLGFIFKFTGIIDLLVFGFSLFLFSILSLNIYLIFSFIKKIYAYIFVNLSFGIIFSVFKFLADLNNFYTISTVLLLTLINFIFYKKMSKNISFEKIVIKE